LLKVPKKDTKNDMSFFDENVVLRRARTQEKEV